ncbi:class I SAM-dependent methyltransferase [bacterium]|nr:class I SAM-dependent methyltransferase [bacterium]
MSVDNGLSVLLRQADARRSELRRRFHAEGTNAWRVFHGIAEGRPGLTVDRYGEYLLAMVFFDDLASAEWEALKEYANSEQLRLVVWARQGKAKSAVLYADTSSDGAAPLAQGADWSLEALCREQGQTFAVASFSHGKDPYLFLDFRAGRRWLRSHALPGMCVLNLFAYTCTAGVAAAANGAAVTNVDFSRWCLEIGRRNAEINGIPAARFKTWQEDVFPIVRQLSQLGVKGRAARRRYMRVEPQSFDIIVLDPPTVANSAFGRVDLQNDYASMLKPCLLCLAEGGSILATNHHAQVTWEEWRAVLERTAVKIGLPAPSIERIYPDADFPSCDGEHPLKLAVLTLPGGSGVSKCL